MRVFQNEILYDMDFFEFVGFVNTDTRFQVAHQTRTTGDNIVKVLVLDQELSANQVLCTFQLRVKAGANVDGGTIESDAAAAKAYSEDGETIAITPKDLEVTIKDDDNSGSGGGNGTGGNTGGGNNGGGVTQVIVVPDDITIGDDKTPLGTLDNPRFDDVNADHWAFSYIEYLAELGFVNGKTAKLFYPSDNISRAEFVTILARMSGENLPTYSAKSTPFSDIDGSAYYAAAVAWAYDSGVVNGTSATTFTPDAKVTRQDIAVMIVRYAAYKGFSFGAVNELREFTDNDAIAEYASDAVASMQRANIINGYTDGSFKPTGNATRAETAKMLALIHNAMFPGLLD